jgi:hypothetical protein
MRLQRGGGSRTPLRTRIVKTLAVPGDPAPGGVDPETQIRILRERHELSAAESAAIELYGPQVLGFLVTVLRSEGDARAAFSRASVELRACMRAFDESCSVRTRFYALAWAAARGGRRTSASKRAAAGAGTDCDEVPPSRTESLVQLQPAHGPAAIRDTLNEADHALLVLRVDRAMPWEDVARVLSPERLSPPPGVAAALEDRFRSLCDEIRARAVADGLVREPGVAR